MREVVQGAWPELPSHYPHVLLDTFIVMPNHIHGIIALEENGDVGAGLKPAPTLPGDGRHALPEIIRGLKTFSSRSINKLRGTPGQRVWQRNYYERVIRNEEELWRVRDYIERNPSQWASDGENPEQVRATLMRAGFNPPLQTTSNRYSTTG